jgi:large subunit ribosomal protein L25
LEIIELKANLRSATGNGPARVLRRDGKIPAILYGPKTDPILLHVDTHGLELALKKGKIGQSLFNLTVENGNSFSKTVMIRELQAQPATHAFLHADFYEIDMDRKTTVNIPVVLTGKAKGVELGGVLQVVCRELTVLCLPSNIPDAIRIDISDLDIGDSLHARDIHLGEGIEIDSDVNFTVVTVLSPKLETDEKGGKEAGEEEAGDAGSDK